MSDVSRAVRLSGDSRGVVGVSRLVKCPECALRGISPSHNDGRKSARDA